MMGDNLNQKEKVDEMEIDDSAHAWNEFFEKHESLNGTKFVDLLREAWNFLTTGTEFASYDIQRQAAMIRLWIGGKLTSLTEDQVKSALEILKAEQRVDIPEPTTWDEFFQKHKSLNGTKFVDLLRAEWNFQTTGTEFASFDIQRQAAMIKLGIEVKLPNLTVDQVKTGLSILMSSMKNDVSPQGRGASITDGLDIELVHSYDLKAFRRRVDDLFGWYDNDESSKYLAPYIPFVQSSGMGKTKILTAYRKACNLPKSDPPIRRHCLTILCQKEAQLLPSERYRQYFDQTLDISAFGPSDEECRVSLWDRLDKMLKDIPESKDQVVLMFDEAQGLMGGGESENMAFRALRWWLRKDDRQELKVVAVLAGTTARLTNFFPPDAPPGTVSRASKIPYRNYDESNPVNERKLILYEPFYKLNTIACLRKNPSRAAVEGDQSSSTNDVVRAAIYGRPLFAHYALEGSLLEEKKLADFAKRLVLSSRKYEDYLPACLSVLGSRVQMGAVGSIDTLSELISSGYACLVDFQARPRDTGGFETSITSPRPAARLAFMPDPVVAWLAMRYMDQDFNLTANLKGKSKQFWVEKAALAFQTKLCLPAKGDVGEVFAGLYMLMCGDELRKAIDPSWCTFDVFLNDWFNLLKNGGKHGDEPSDTVDTVDTKKAKIEVKEGVTTRRKKKESAMLQQQASDTNARRKMMVSFIQICRNEMRADSFCEPSKLEHLYRAGLGCYAYNNCKGIDIAASIRITSARKAAEHKSVGKDGVMIEEDVEKFHPLFVSVKNWATVSKSDVIRWEESLKSFLCTARKKNGSDHTTAVCIILLVGCSDPPCMSDNDLGLSDLQPFPEEDIFRFVCLPEQDEFGISKALQGLASASVRSEMYSSHGFVPGEATSEDFLRSNASAEDKEEVSAWFEAITNFSPAAAAAANPPE